MNDEKNSSKTSRWQNATKRGRMKSVGYSSPHRSTNSYHQPTISSFLTSVVHKSNPDPSRFDDMSNISSMTKPVNSYQSRYDNNSTSSHSKSMYRSNDDDLTPGNSSLFFNDQKSTTCFSKPNYADHDEHYTPFNHSSSNQKTYSSRNSISIYSHCVESRNYNEFISTDKHVSRRSDSSCGTEDVTRRADDDKSYWKLGSACSTSSCPVISSNKNHPDKSYWRRGSPVSPRKSPHHSSRRDDTNVHSSSSDVEFRSYNSKSHSSSRSYRSRSRSPSYRINPKSRMSFGRERFYNNRKERSRVHGRKRKCHSSNDAHSHCRERSKFKWNDRDKNNGKHFKNERSSRNSDSQSGVKRDDKHSRNSAIDNENVCFADKDGRKITGLMDLESNPNENFYKPLLEEKMTTRSSRSSTSCLSESRNREKPCKKNVDNKYNQNRESSVEEINQSSILQCNPGEQNFETENSSSSSLSKLQSERSPLISEPALMSETDEIKNTTVHEQVLGNPHSIDVSKKTLENHLDVKDKSCDDNSTRKKVKLDRKSFTALETSKEASKYSTSVSQSKNLCSVTEFETNEHSDNKFGTDNLIVTSKSVDSTCNVSDMSFNEKSPEVTAAVNESGIRDGFSESSEILKNKPENKTSDTRPAQMIERKCKLRKRSISVDASSNESLSKQFEKLQSQERFKSKSANSSETESEETPRVTRSRSSVRAGLSSDARNFMLHKNSCVSSRSSSPATSTECSTQVTNNRVRPFVDELLMSTSSQLLYTIPGSPAHSYNQQSSEEQNDRDTNVLKDVNEVEIKPKESLELHELQAGQCEAKENSLANFKDKEKYKSENNVRKNTVFASEDNNENKNKTQTKKMQQINVRIKEEQGKLASSHKTGKKKNTTCKKSASENENVIGDSTNKSESIATGSSKKQSIVKKKIEKITELNEDRNFGKQCKMVKRKNLLQTAHKNYKQSDAKNSKKLQLRPAQSIVKLTVKNKKNKGKPVNKKDISYETTEKIPALEQRTHLEHYNQKDNESDKAVSETMPEVKESRTKSDLILSNEIHEAEYELNEGKGKKQSEVIEAFEKSSTVDMAMRKTASKKKTKVTRKFSLGTTLSKLDVHIVSSKENSNLHFETSSPSKNCSVDNIIDANCSYELLQSDENAKLQDIPCEVLSNDDFIQNTLEDNSSLCTKTSYDKGTVSSLRKISEILRRPIQIIKHSRRVPITILDDKKGVPMAKKHLITNSSQFIKILFIENRVEILPSGKLGYPIRGDKMNLLKRMESPSLSSPRSCNKSKNAGGTPASTPPSHKKKLTFSALKSCEVILDVAECVTPTNSDAIFDLDSNTVNSEKKALPDSTISFEVPMNSILTNSTDFEKQQCNDSLTLATEELLDDKNVCSLESSSTSFRREESGKVLNDVSQSLSTVDESCFKPPPKKRGRPRRKPLPDSDVAPSVLTDCAKRCVEDSFRDTAEPIFDSTIGMGRSKRTPKFSQKLIESIESGSIGLMCMSKILFDQAKEHAKRDSESISTPTSPNCVIPSNDANQASNNESSNLPLSSDSVSSKLKSNAGEKIAKILLQSKAKQVTSSEEKLVPFQEAVEAEQSEKQLKVAKAENIVTPFKYKKVECCGKLFPENLLIAHMMRKTYRGDLYHQEKLVARNYVKCEKCHIWTRAAIMPVHMQNIHRIAMSSTSLQIDGKITINLKKQTVPCKNSQKSNGGNKIFKRKSMVVDLGEKVNLKEDNSVSSGIVIVENRKPILRGILTNKHGENKIRNLSNKAYPKKTVTLKSPSFKKSQSKLTSEMNFAPNDFQASSDESLSDTSSSSSQTCQRQRKRTRRCGNIDQFSDDDDYFPPVSGGESNKMPLTERTFSSSIQNNSSAVKTKAALRSNRKSSLEPISKEEKPVAENITIENKGKPEIKGEVRRKRGRPRIRPLVTNESAATAAVHDNSATESELENKELNKENIPQVHLDMYSFSSGNNQAIYITDPTNFNLKIYSNMDSVFVSDPFLLDKKALASYLTENNNIIYVNPKHCLFPKHSALHDYVPHPIIVMKTTKLSDLTNGKSAVVRKVLCENNSLKDSDALVLSKQHDNHARNVASDVEDTVENTCSPRKEDIQNKIIENDGYFMSNDGSFNVAENREEMREQTPLNNDTWSESTVSCKEVLDHLIDSSLKSPETCFQREMFMKDGTHEPISQSDLDIHTSFENEKSTAIRSEPSQLEKSSLSIAGKTAYITGKGGNASDEQTQQQNFDSNSSGHEVQKPTRVLSMSPVMTAFSTNKQPGEYEQPSSAGPRKQSSSQQTSSGLLTSNEDVSAAEKTSNATSRNTLSNEGNDIEERVKDVFVKPLSLAKKSSWAFLDDDSDEFLSTLEFTDTLQSPCGTNTQNATEERVEASSCSDKNSNNTVNEHFLPDICDSVEEKQKMSNVNTLKTSCLANSTAYDFSSLGDEFVLDISEIQFVENPANSGSMKSSNYSKLHPGTPQRARRASVGSPNYRLMAQGDLPTLRFTTRELETLSPKSSLARKISDSELSTPANRFKLSPTFISPPSRKRHISFDDTDDTSVRTLKTSAYSCLSDNDIFGLWPTVNGLPVASNKLSKKIAQSAEEVLATSKRFSDDDSQVLEIDLLTEFGGDDSNIFETDQCNGRTRTILTSKSPKRFRGKSKSFMQHSMRANLSTSSSGDDSANELPEYLNERERDQCASLTPKLPKLKIAVSLNDGSGPIEISLDSLNKSGENCNAHVLENSKSPVETNFAGNLPFELPSPLVSNSTSASENALLTSNDNSFSMNENGSLTPNIANSDLMRESVSCSDESNNAGKHKEKKTKKKKRSKELEKYEKGIKLKINLIGMTTQMLPFQLKKKNKGKYKKKKRRNSLDNSMSHMNHQDAMFNMCTDVTRVPISPVKCDVNNSNILELSSTTTGEVQGIKQQFEAMCSHLTPDFIPFTLPNTINEKDENIPEAEIDKEIKDARFVSSGEEDEDLSGVISPPREALSSDETDKEIQQENILHESEIPARKKSPSKAPIVSPTRPWLTRNAKLRAAVLISDIQEGITDGSILVEGDHFGSESSKQSHDSKSRSNKSPIREKPLLRIRRKSFLLDDYQSDVSNESTYSSHELSLVETHRTVSTPAYSWHTQGCKADEEFRELGRMGDSEATDDLLATESKIYSSSDIRKFFPPSLKRLMSPARSTSTPKRFKKKHTSPDIRSFFAPKTLTDQSTPISVNTKIRGLKRKRDPDYRVTGILDRVDERNIAEKRVKYSNIDVNIPVSNLKMWYELRSCRESVPNEYSSRSSRDFDGFLSADSIGTLSSNATSGLPNRAKSIRRLVAQLNMRTWYKSQLFSMPLDQILDWDESQLTSLLDF